MWSIQEKIPNLKKIDQLSTEHYVAFFFKSNLDKLKLSPNVKIF